MTAFLPLILALRAFAAPAAGTLPDAIASGAVRAVFTGMDASSGDAIVVEVENLRAEAMVFSVPPGLVLQNGRANAQDMVVKRVHGRMVDSQSFSPESEISLPSKGKGRWVLEAYCLEFHDANPSSSDQFGVGNADPYLAALFESASGTAATQAAVWAYTDNPSAAELTSKFPASSAIIESAAAAYEAALGGASARALFVGTTPCQAAASPSQSRAPAWIPVPRPLQTGCAQAQSEANTAWHHAVERAALDVDFSAPNPNLAWLHSLSAARVAAAGTDAVEAFRLAEAATAGGGSAFAAEAITAAKAASSQAWEQCRPG